MESLQERKAKLEKEMREIEALEKAQSIRESEANKNELIERLLTDLRDAPLGCALPLASVSHVKSVFRQPACKGELCGFFDTCAQIISLTGKASPVKRNGKASGERSGKVSDTNLKKIVSKGYIKIIDKTNGRIEFSYIGDDYSEYLTKLRDHFYTGKPQTVKSEFVGLTKQAVQGFEHKGHDNKYYNVFIGK